MLPGRGRSHGPLVNSVTAPHTNVPSQPELRPVDEARNPLLAREAILPRGRLPGSPNVATGPTPTQAFSPRSQSSTATARSPLGPSDGLERRPSVQGYHHNNRSHGGHQHIRNTSFVNSPTTSPLSPQTTPAEHVGMNIMHHSNLDQRSKDPLANIGNGSSPMSGNGTGETDISRDTPVTSTQRRVDRAHGSKQRLGHTHQRTHSRQHHQEQKTVGEYALHHLFTAVCLHCLEPNRD